MGLLNNKLTTFWKEKFPIETLYVLHNLLFQYAKDVLLENVVVGLIVT